MARIGLQVNAKSSQHYDLSRLLAWRSIARLVDLTLGAPIFTFLNTAPVFPTTNAPKENRGDVVEFCDEHTQFQLAAQPKTARSAASGTACAAAPGLPCAANSRPANSRPANSRPANSRPANSRPASTRPTFARAACTRATFARAAHTNSTASAPTISACSTYSCSTYSCPTEPGSSATR
ncbi:MAG: hypothetical protein ACI9G1_000332 [Pirellulaceae bacterium]|jgi:hypothetical protein